MPAVGKMESRPPVQLAQMRQQAEVRVPEDDWTGSTDAATRRKLQNRLNQRIYRKRRGASKPDVNPTKVETTSHERSLSGKFNGLVNAVGHLTVVEEEKKHDVLAQRDGSSPLRPTAANSSLTGPRSRYITPPKLVAMVARFEEIAQQDYMLGSPRLDLLLTLIQFNVFRALISNTLALGWTLEWLECSDPISPWNKMSENEELAYPQALRPTHLQRTVEHHPWIDLWPIPNMRDNLLLAGDSYDEDQLCNDLVEFVDLSNEQTGLIVWNEPWDPAGWEVSETFLKNWGWTLVGCGDLMRSTNYWRSMRGEKPLFLEMKSRTDSTQGS